MSDLCGAPSFPAAYRLPPTIPAVGFEVNGRQQAAVRIPAFWVVERLEVAKHLPDKTAAASGIRLVSLGGKKCVWFRLHGLRDQFSRTSPSKSVRGSGENPSRPRET